MARLMLDTNICIHVINRDQPEITRRLERYRAGDVVISSVVAAELWTGVMKSRERTRNERVLRDFLAVVETLDWPAAAARIYGEIRAQLEAGGFPIGPMDMLIAAHAVHERLSLVTRNVREFRRVAGLRVEEWR